MKKELKTSRFAVFCVLFVGVTLPAFSASSVRSLGGAGTYASASSAAAAKSGESASGGAVRAGSMRVNNVAGATSGATRSGSTRAATTPRLSIGKYLSGSSAISGGSSTQGGVNVGGAASSGNDLRDRVEALENFVAFKASGDTLAQQLSGVKLDIQKLSEDVAAVTDGVTGVVFDDLTGVLTVESANGQKQPYDLNLYFDGRIEDALQAVLDDVMDDYYTKSDVDAALAEVRDALKAAIDAKQDAGDFVLLKEFEDLKSVVEGLQVGGVDKEKLEGLQAAIDVIEKEYAKNSELTDVEKRLRDEIKAIDVPSLNEYVKSADLANVATTGSYEDLLNKPQIPSIDGLAEKSYVDAELAGKASATVVQNLQQDIANNYLTKSEVQNTYVTQQEAADTYITQQKAADTYVTSQDVAQQITNVVGTDTTGLKKQVADNKAAIEAIDLASYAKSADVYTKTEVDDKVAEVVAGDMDEALKPYAKAADVEAELAKKADASVLTNYALKTELSVDYVTSGKLAEIQGALQAQIDDKQAKGEYLTADSLADINQAISDLQSGKADAAVVKQLQDSVNALDGTYVKDSELQSAIQGVEALISAIKVPTKTSDLDNDSGFITESALTDYALKTELPDVTDLATKSDLNGYALKSEIPTGFVTEEQLTSLQNTLQAAIDGKQAKGDYAAASDLTKLQEDVAALQAGGSGGGVVDTSALETRIKAIEDTYATDAELSQAISEIRDLIPSTDAFVSNPGDPDSKGAYYLHAQCTGSKCRYSWKLVSSIVGGDDSNVGDI